MPSFQFTQDCTDFQLQDLLPLGICVIDPFLRVHEWNQKLVDWTGLSRDCALGMNLGERYPHLLSDRYYVRLKHAFETHSPVIFSAALHKRFMPIEATGKQEGLMIQQTLVRPLQNCRDRALVVIQDVTVQYTQMEQLRRERSDLQNAIEQIQRQSAALSEARALAEQANRVKSEFLANMSHEIRTPMNSVLGFTERLLERLGDSLGARDLDALQTVDRNAKHLLRLINDILDLSKIEAGKLIVEHLACSPHSIVDSVVSPVRETAKAKGLSLEVDIDPTTPETIISDPTRLRQILTNLLSNALKFTESGYVRLVVGLANDDASPQKLQFEVIDSGIGMTTEHMCQLFQPFTQADASTTRKFGGTGLGLAITKRLTEKLGGEIQVSSELGKGSRFRVTIANGPLDGDSMDHVAGVRPAPESE